MSKRKMWFRMAVAFMVGSVLTLVGVHLTLGHFLGSAGAVDFLRTMLLVEKQYVETVDRDKLWQGSIKGLAESLDDPHSVYLDEEMFEIFKMETSGSFGGVGLVVGERDKNIIVVAPIEGTPGEKAGVKSGDIIVKIDGEDISKLNLTEAVSKIRGEEGSKVTLTIRRGQETKEFTIVRENIQMHAVSGKMLEGNIGYLRITNFNETVADDLKKEYARLEAEGMKKIVLDLRDNPGGLLDKSVDVAERFVKAGPVVSIIERDGSRTTYESKSDGCPYPIVVLVNEGSASASEIVAGAIKDTEAGILIGTKTYGKGSVQSIMPLGSGAVKLTIAKYYTPNEQVIDGVGITPNIVIEAKKTDAQDKVLQAAIDHLKKK